MRVLATGIFFLSGDPSPVDRAALEATLEPHRGIRGVGLRLPELLLTVCFDRRQTGLAEIVRVIEDSGWVVASVAERAMPLRRTLPERSRRIDALARGLRPWCGPSARHWG